MEQVLQANQELRKEYIINENREYISAIDRTQNVMYVPRKKYGDLNIEDIIEIDIYDENIEEGYALHREIYKRCISCQSILISQKRYTMCFATLKEEIPPLNTVHSPRFFGEIPCVKKVVGLEESDNYEESILDNLEVCMKKYVNNPMPAYLIPYEGAVCFGTDPMDAYVLAIQLEKIAEIAYSVKSFVGVCYEYMPLNLMERTNNRCIERIALCNSVADQD